MKKILLLLLLTSSNLFAQVVGTQPSPTATYTATSNLLNPTVNAWTGTVQGQNGGFIGGNTPAFNPSTNTIIFGYTQATAMQTIAINQALSGTGIQVGGYNYSWSINNDPATMQYGTLTGQVVLKDSVGNALQTYNYNYPQTSGGFTNFSGRQWFPQNYSLSGLSNLELSFTGKDARFWAGYYGPQVRNPSLTLQYTVDPCATNPAYSPSCPGYNTVQISNNLLPGTTGTQAYAINQALALAGAGATIHGFDYGYNYSVAGRQCAIFDLFGFCLTGWNYSDAGVATVITDSNNATIFSESNTHNGGNNGVSGSYSKKYRLNSSVPMSTLGAFAMSPWTIGAATISNMYSNAVYTPDPCLANPLSSPSCAGYAQAYFNQQCSSNALFDPQCPGYAAAYFNQQCTLNQLYNPSCPGYAAAYLTQQCSLNPLYAPQCPGYAQAYLNQQCTANPLYDSACPGYNTASTQCALNPLYASYCPSYQNATTQCSSNALYASYCPGYSTAQTTCSTNPLSNTLCSGYSTASNACSSNQLTYSYCPNYTTTLASCGSNPQSNKMCPGYNSNSSSSTASNSSNPSPTSFTRSTTETTIAVASDGKVEAGVSKTGDSNADRVIKESAIVNSAAEPAAPVQLSKQNSENNTGPAPTAVAVAAERKQEKQEDKIQEEKKQDGATSGGTTQSAQSTPAKSDSQNAGGQKTARQEINERRAEVAKQQEISKGKEAQKEMSNAQNFEQQKQVQTVVISAMSFVPGFDVYGKTFIPDGRGYQPFTVYNNQKNVDNARTLRGLSGASERLHNEMVELQWK